MLSYLNCQEILECLKQFWIIENYKEDAETAENSLNLNL